MTLALLATNSQTFHVLEADSAKQAELARLATSKYDEYATVHDLLAESAEVHAPIIGFRGNVYKLGTSM